jgi:flagellar hook-associated protein 3 FlgL
MRIATSTIYTQQSNAISNLEVGYQSVGQQLSTGVALGAPSDDPTRIGQDLRLRTTLATDAQKSTNIEAATGLLTTTDSVLANLTSVLQSSRTLAVQAASDLVSPAALKTIGTQVDEYLTQAVGMANTQYGTSYIFAGSVQQTTAPVTTLGSPVTSVQFSGNEQSAAPMLHNGQSFALSPTLQQSFNYSSTDGSPSVFDVLKTLRDTVDQGIVTDQSAEPVNHAGRVIFGAGSPTPTTLAVSPSPFAVIPAADNGTPPQFSIEINNNDASGAQHVVTYTFPATAAVDDGTANSIVGKINATLPATGLVASFDATQQKLVFTNSGGGAFYVKDVPSTGATTTSNFTTMFHLSESATLPETISTQLGDIDHALDVVLGARAVVGSRINALARIGDQVSSDVLNNTATKSGIEDTNVAAATTQLSAIQTSLQAAYSTTTRLESKTLFDYL